MPVTLLTFVQNQIQNQSISVNPIMYAIVLLPMIPLRISNTETSEMVSQLLYGELVIIIEETERWLKIQNISDGYIGWVDQKMLTRINDPVLFESLNTEDSFFVDAPFKILSNSLSQQVLLPGGSVIRSKYPFFHNQSHLLLQDFPFVRKDTTEGNEILEIADKYLNVPYLWGGKTVLGIDCSGLVQTVFTIAGFQLPRDASQQIEYGSKVHNLSESKPGDLVFFKNDNGTIHHVGILASQNTLIHASGWVKYEKIDCCGIISSITGEYTHKLEAIKRIE